MSNITLYIFHLSSILHSHLQTAPIGPPSAMPRRNPPPPAPAAPSFFLFSTTYLTQKESHGGICVGTRIVGTAVGLRVVGFLVGLAVVGLTVEEQFGHSPASINSVVCVQQWWAWMRGKPLAQQWWAWTRGSPWVCQ